MIIGLRAQHALFPIVIKIVMFAWNVMIGDTRNEQKDCCNIDGGDYLERLS